ncbi:hypothetical protein AKI39_11370 [Bordetella sp. H567]|nr:hypothetical protein AKI39_11370 [Bordetella sp. H567]
MAVCLAIIGVGIFVPLYGDETATKLMRGMFIANGWKFNTLLPQCRPEFLREVPRLLLPGALAYDFAYSHASPLGIRIGGMVVDVGIMGFLGIAVKSWADSKQSRLPWIAAVICVAGLGVLPLTLVMARGEQMLLLLLLIFICAPHLISRYVPRLNVGWILACAIAFCVLQSIFFYTHPKSLFFFPVLFLSAWLAFWPINRVACACVLVITLLTLRAALHFAFALTDCPGAPIFATFMQSQTTPPSLIWSHPLEFVAQVWNNVRNAPDAMLVHMKFADVYQSGWLTASQGVAASRLTRWVNGGIESIVYAVYLCAAILPPATLVCSLVRRQRANIAAWILMALWVSIAAHVAMYRVWNFYSAGLVLPLMMISATLSAIELSSMGVLKASTRTLFIWLSPLYLLFFASAAVLLFKVMPSTIHASRSPGIDMQGQLFSVPVFNYGSRRAEIRSFASQCGVKGDAAKRLVIDNLTLFAFDGLREPLQSDYVTEKAFGVDYRGEAQLALLRRARAKAIIARCTLLSDTVRAAAVEKDGLCCLDLNRPQ